jgi:hypothetical protein
MRTYSWYVFYEQLSILDGTILQELLNKGNWGKRGYKAQTKKAGVTASLLRTKE